MKWFRKKEKEQRKLSPEEHEKNKQLAENAAKYAMFAGNTQPQASNMGLAGKGGGFDISNAQKVAAYNLLMNTKDD